MEMDLFKAIDKKVSKTLHDLALNQSGKLLENPTSIDNVERAAYGLFPMSQLVLQTMNVTSKFQGKMDLNYMSVGMAFALELIQAAVETIELEDTAEASMEGIND